ncbi:DUF1684 domain-containing protein [Humibacter ginsenosidimutans]|uniref:DUF1684 domain-containing protein n=1 Tax=Humibacter ginsenosidimutans TaxID=2599293 RepID=A0A5B8LZW5_9MICO|nr:DUF1684 domain-containing protein [Humibacter ginsenosidimutans]QDZ13917.1 DUF1684 domain-containing protein [Humibacter ginsenosidimutans]
MTDTTAAPVTDPAELLATFHSRRELSVVQPTGSLALVNTQWITDAAPQPVWGAAGLWAPLPAGESGLKVTASAADGVSIDGVPVDGEAVAHGKDSDAPSTITFGDTVSGTVIANEAGEYALRVWDTQSEGIKEFGSIDAYPYNPEWVVQAAFTPVEGLTVGFEHIKDEGATRELAVPGEITFSKDGVDYNLAAFKAGRALQLVFSDATSGDATYSVGRFLFVAPNADGTITLDFNRAILPPCAFSYAFNCPMPPKQNRFSVPIEAGEKNVLKKDGTLLHEL